MSVNESAFAERFRHRTRREKKRAFTLIELLVVVAIIAILAAIAVPNFLEAQTRAKVSRVKTDMRTITVGLESFATDNNHYPQIALFQLTRPVEYLSEAPADVFRLDAATSGRRGRGVGIRYGKMPIGKPSRYALASVGPDLDIDEYIERGGFQPESMALNFYPGYSPELFSESGAAVNDSVLKYIVYDPTNGTISDGDLFRLSDFQFPMN